MKKDYLTTKPIGNILNKKFLISALSVIVFFIFSTENIYAQAEIDVLGNAISIIGDGTNTPNLADGTDFGQITAGTSSGEQIFTIENTGTAPLTVGPSFTTNLPVFSISTDPGVTVVPVGTSINIGITFNAPVGPPFGIQNAILFITNNDPDESPVYQINLQGENVTPPPEIDVLGNSIAIIGDGTNAPILVDGTDFGPVAQGTSSNEHIFTIQNTGLGPLNVGPSLTSNLLVFFHYNNTCFTCSHWWINNYWNYL